MIHNVYARLPLSIVGEVDGAYAHARRVLDAAGPACDNGDSADARLVEALAVYVLASNPALSAELPGGAV